MATALLIAGGGLAAFGEIKKGQIAEAQGKLDKRIAVRNAAALARQAKAEQDAAAIEESRIARKEKIVKASQRVAFAKAGGGIEGASLSFLADTAAQFSFERNITLRRGLLRSRELLARGRIITAQGQFAKTLGKATKRASFIKAGGSVLTTVGLSGFRLPGGSPGAGIPGTGGGLPGLGGSRFPGTAIT